MDKSGDISTTVIIRRPAKVKPDDRGGSIWEDTIEEVELELMSTSELNLALKSASESDRKTIQKVIESGKRGVIARDRSTGLYEIISDQELQELLEADKDLRTKMHSREMVPEQGDTTDDEALSLVSTQELKRMLGQDEPDEASVDPDDLSGFNPYNKG